MSKVEFLRKYRNDYAFRAECKAKGIKVIQDNVIFFNPDGPIKAWQRLTSSKPTARKKIKN